MLDRFSAAGAERKAGLDAFASVDVTVGRLERSVGNKLTVESEAETENRSRMAIEVPGFRPAAQGAIEQVRVATDATARERGVAGMSLEVRAEIAQVDKALRARFGNDAGAEDSQSGGRSLPMASLSVWPHRAQDRMPELQGVFPAPLALRETVATARWFHER